MSFGRTIFAACASAAVAVVAPATASAATTVSYVTGSSTCTTKDAQQPNASTQAARAAANHSWMQPPAQSQMTTRLPSGQSPNDFAVLTTFPTVYVQPIDDAAGPKTTPTLPSPAIKTLPVSTCSSAT